MYRIILGIVIGIAISIYFEPYISNIINNSPREVISNALPSFDDKQPPARTVTRSTNTQQSQSSSLPSEIMTAISLTQNRAPNESASDYTIKLISKLADAEPKIQSFVLQKIKGGLTNQEALEIFEKYYEANS